MLSRIPHTCQKGERRGLSRLTLSPQAPALTSCAARRPSRMRNAAVPCNEVKS